jgi:cbb3-type cytochrome oxidase maturation protein
MYYPYFIAYMAIGFAIGLLMFFWALSKGQFKDQERARFLPLEDGDRTSQPVSRFYRYEAYALGALVLLGLAASGAVLIFSLFFVGGSGAGG